MSDWSTAANLAMNRRNRRENMWDRLFGAGQQLGQNVFAKRQADAQRGFESEEAERLRDFQASESALYRELQREEGEAERAFAAAEAEKVRGFTADENEAERATRQQLQDDMQAFELEIQSVRDASELEQLQMGIDARIAELERGWEQPREEYTRQSTTISGRTYTWASDQEYELVALKMQADMINDRIRLEAALRDEDATDEDRYSITAAYNYLRENILLDPNTGELLTADSFDAEELQQRYETFLAAWESDNQALTPFQRQVVHDMFFGIERQDKKPPVTTGRATTPFGYGTRRSETTEQFARTGPVSATVSWLFGALERIFPRLMERGVRNLQQAGIDEDEQGFLEALLGARENADEQTQWEIDQQINRLRQERVSSGDAEMAAFIDQLSGGLSTEEPDVVTPEERDIWERLGLYNSSQQPFSTDPAALQGRRHMMSLRRPGVSPELDEIDEFLRRAGF